MSIIITRPITENAFRNVYLSSGARNRWTSMRLDFAAKTAEGYGQGQEQGQGQGQR
jgi:hypothetical protein